MADAPAAAAETPKDEFADAFANLTVDEGAPVVDKPKAEGEAAGTDTAGQGTQVEIEGVLPDPKTIGADGKPVDDKPAGEAPKVEEKPAPKAEEKPAPGADDLLDRFRNIVREEVKPAPKAEEKPAEQPTVTPFTTEQQALVDQYIKDFPDVYTAEQLIRKQEYQAFANWMFDQIRPHIEALRGQTTQLVATNHVDQLYAAVPDYDEVVPKVQEWIGKQPDYIKAAYEAVAQRGSTQQVVDLIGRYRAETGTAAPAAAAGGEKPAANGNDAGGKAPAEEKPALDPKKEKLLQGLAPVSSKRSGVSSGGISADDFDGAFAAFSKAS